MERTPTFTSLIILVMLSVQLFGGIKVLWQKAVGGFRNDVAYSIYQTRDGGYIVAGWTESRDKNISGYHGDKDFWIVKLDKNGNIQWQRALGGTKEDEARSIQQTSDGGYIVAGWTFSNDGNVSGNHGGSDFWIIKLDRSGNIQWQKTLGGSENDYAYSIQQTSDGGYIVVGYTTSNDEDVSGNHGERSFWGWWPEDAWIVKLDSKGNIQWQRSLGGSDDDAAYSVQQTSDGGYIVAGCTSSNDGDVNVLEKHLKADIWIIKLDKKGNLQWQRILGGSSDECPNAILQTQDGGYVIAGHTFSKDGDVYGFHKGVFSGDAWIVKLDKRGNTQWQKTLGGFDSDEAYSVLQTPDGGYIIAGYTCSSNGDVSENHGGDDFWIVKLNKNERIEWQKTLGGSDDEEAYSIQRTTDGGYVVAGYTESNDYDVSGNHGLKDFWIVKFKY